MENQITFQGKTFEFTSEFEREGAQMMLERMTAANKSTEYIHAMLAGLGKLSTKAEKFAALEEYQKITAAIRTDGTIQSLVNSAIAQFAAKSELLGVQLNDKLGNRIVADLDEIDLSQLVDIITNAAVMTDEVTLSFLQEDDKRYVRVSVEAKDALDTIGRANTAALDLVSDSIKEKGVHIKTGDDWYPKAMPVGAGGGSKAGLTKTRFVKFIWNGKEYDGLKKPVAKQVIADGLGTSVTVGDKTAKLSGDYYSKFLDQVAELGTFRDYEKYNKAATE